MAKLRSSNEHKSYLEKIRFDPKLLNSFTAKYITNIRLVILFVVSVLIIGLISYFTLPKRLNPEIKIPIVIVSSALPGASAADTENLLTVPLENAVKNVKGIDKITSVSRENISVITIQFLSTVDGEKARNDTETQVSTVTSLPEDATEPKVIALDFEDEPVWTFALSSKSNPINAYNYALILKKKIEENRKIDRVDLTGDNRQHINITLKNEFISQYNLNPLIISSAVKKALSSYPSGNLENSVYSFSLGVDSQINNISDIRNTLIVINGITLKLSDIAQISQKAVIPQTRSYIANKDKVSREAVIFYVYKASGVNIDEADKAVKEIVENSVSQYQGEFEITSLLNSAEEIDNQFSELINEFISTVILIVICLYIFLGLRQAIISSFTMPLTFLSAFFLMNSFGLSINFLTLFALLLTLGLLIDDTIVVVSAMTSYYKTGKFTPIETGLIVWRDTIIPIWSTTLTTIWSFVPLLLSTGIIGEFIKSIPLVVTFTMVSSTTIAVLITLPLMIVLLRPKVERRVKILFKILIVAAIFVLVYSLSGKNISLVLILLLTAFAIWLFRRIYKRLIKESLKIISGNFFLNKLAGFIHRTANHGVIEIEPFANKYYKLIIRILKSSSSRKKVLAAIGVYTVVSFSLLPLGLVKNEFFPKTDSEIIYISLNMPPGTNIQTTDKKTLEILEDVRQTPNVKYAFAETGKQYSSQGNRNDDISSSVITLKLTSEKQRPKSSMEIATDLRNKYKKYQEGELSVFEISSGPPAGADLQISILGDDLTQIDEITDKIKDYLNTLSGVENVAKSIRPQTSKLVFVPDKNKLAQYGISVDSLGLWLRIHASGLTVDDVDFENSNTGRKDIIIKTGTELNNLADLSSFQISGQSGIMYPLNALGNIEAKSNPVAIRREDLKRVITVSASALPGYNISQLNKKLEAFADSLSLPSGYEWRTGGVNEENRKSVISILQAMVLAFLLILVTMVIQFQSYRQALLVLIVIPLAVSSVFVIFALTQTPLSFPALIGILSLFGIVVTNSMFIVDKININLKEKMPFVEAIADAGSSRMEPIILTKLSTVLGLLPITLSNPLWRGLGGAIISGLLLASSIMLLFIPVLYFEWFKPVNIKK